MDDHVPKPKAFANTLLQLISVSNLLNEINNNCDFIKIACIIVGDCEVIWCYFSTSKVSAKNSKVVITQQ